MKKLLKDFVTIAKNSKNDQNYLIIKKRKLKEFDLDVDDILETKIKKKLSKFRGVM